MNTETQRPAELAAAHGSAVRLEYFDGKKWIPAGAFENEAFCWISLGGDDRNYRTVDAASGKVLTDKSVKPNYQAQARGTEERK